ncbi:MAG: ROK family transcriptional regulator [Synergistaceae bacterium]|nr:ROK family transcriptional regulator [Synergistaceae bacterium]
MKRITQEDIHNTNRQIIYRHIYHGRTVSQKDIPHALKMSRPTVTAHLSAMENEGLIFRSTPGNSDSQSHSAGRRPITWSVNSRYKIALGVEILKDVVKIIAIDLYGLPLKCEVLHEKYENSERYYEHITVKVREFIASLEVDDADKKILGIGFALQGLVSENGDTVIYGEILKCTGLKIDVFTKWLDYPCCFVHEPDGAALSELWVSHELQDAVYLSMSEHLGGAFISDRRILNGQHRHSATFEHITACENGELCYCGKRGCYETVCSKVALLKGEKPEEFFRRVRSGESKESERWQNFLSHLGRLIASLHLVYDTNYILGGHLAPYFTESDIDTLYEIVRERTPFAEGKDYILLSKMPSHNITIGAALPYIIKFLDNLPDVKP